MKSITIQTNYNNKMACECFLHIDEAPQRMITETELNNTVFEIRTMDNSHPPVKAKIRDILRLPLAQVVSIYTWPSHGMSSDVYFDWIISNKPNYLPGKEMAVYYYQRQE